MHHSPDCSTVERFICVLCATGSVVLIALFSAPPSMASFVHPAMEAMLVALALLLPVVAIRMLWRILRQLSQGQATDNWSRYCVQVRKGVKQDGSDDSDQMESGGDPDEHNEPDQEHGCECKHRNDQLLACIFFLAIAAAVVAFPQVVLPFLPLLIAKTAGEVVLVIALCQFIRLAMLLLLGR